MPGRKAGHVVPNLSVACVSVSFACMLFCLKSKVMLNRMNKKEYREKREREKEQNNNDDSDEGLKAKKKMFTEREEKHGVNTWYACRHTTQDRQQ